MKTSKILIVEDEVISAMALKQSLAGEGFEVGPLTTTGERALREAEQWKPDLILMDINLPGEMDGIETARKIHSLFGIPTVFMTGYDENDVIKKIASVSSARYLIKPIRFAKLKATIDEMLEVVRNGG